VKLNALRLVFVVLASSASLVAQTNQSASNDQQSPLPQDSNYSVTASSPHTWVQPNYASAPFSHLAFGGGLSSMGINLQAAVNANRYMNIRGSGSFFNYSLNNISVSGLIASGTLDFASARAAVDFYPFPNHGFRVSPGVLFYNHNMVSTTVTATGGTSFTLDGTTYYSSEANPVTGTGSVGLNTQNPAFTFTTGWGNMIPRRGGHLSFPVEIGAAFIGSPAVNLALTGGQVCANEQGTVGCANVVGNSQVQSNLQAQQAKYQNDLNPFRFYPIFSSGITYSFSLRGGQSNPVARPQ